MHRRTFLLGCTGITSLALTGCGTTGSLTPDNIQAFAVQVANYVKLICGFVPDLVAVGNVITALYPPGAVATGIVTTVGNLICTSPTASAMTTQRMARRLANTLEGPMIVNVVHLVPTPAGVIAVPGHM